MTPERVSRQYLAVWFFVLVAQHVVTPSPATAQPSGFLSIGGFVQPLSVDDVSGGSASLSFQNESRDSLVLGLSSELGVQVGAHLSIGVELGLPARGQLVLDSFYFGGFREEVRYRDTTVFGLVRLRPTARSVTPELVVGAGLVHQSAAVRRANRGFTGTGFALGPFFPEHTTSRKAWGLTGGIDLPIRVAARAVVVPQLRVVYTERGDIAVSPGFPRFGISTVAVRAGVAIRATF